MNNKKQRLFKLWAEKGGYLNPRWALKSIKIQYRGYALSEIQALMEADGISRDEIEGLLNEA